MSFLYPLGLLGLLGVPVLIIIYIIKNKHTEQTVASTYLWTLSEKFLKRRNPISKLAGIISLILQILLVIAISLTIAHPVFTVSDSCNEYCFILDATGSMNIESENGSRLENGKKEISKIIEESGDGSLYSLIVVGNGTNIIYEKTSDKEKAIFELNEQKCAYTDQGFGDAIKEAQLFFNDNSSVLTYLVTDTEYKTHNNIEIINVAETKKNFAISDVTYTLSNGKLNVFGNAISYTSDEGLTIELYIDGEDEPSATIDTLEVKKGVKKEFELSYLTNDFNNFKVNIKNSDSLPLDNENVIYNVKSENAYEALIVSDNPFFFKTVIESVSNARVDILMPNGKDTIDVPSGYGLYILDTAAPTTLPSDGAVWFVNQTKNTQNSGFTPQSEIILEKGDTLSLTSSSSSFVKKLIRDMSGKNIYIKSYIKCGFYGNFNTLLSYKGNPVVFTGSNTHGNREVIFSLDIHKSDFAMLPDFVILIRNLLEYSFPAVIEDVFYYGGDKAQVNVIPNCESIRVTSPMNNTTYLSTNSEVAEFTLDEVGVYEITAIISGAPRTYHIYSAMPEAERSPVNTAEEISLYGEAGNDKLDGIYDKFIIFFVLLAVIFTADWMVYCYEKYQLR